MDVLIVSKRFGRSLTLSLQHRGVIVTGVALMLALPGLAAVGGYQMGYSAAAEKPTALAAAYQKELRKQREEVVEAKRDAEDNLNALTLRLGQMQANVTRLNALGQRLTRIAGLDKGEFDFDSVPAQGGPAPTQAEQSIEVPDFVSQLDSLTRELNDREDQLSILQGVLVSRNLQEDTFPTGRPIDRGWISSHYGRRTDPFTGKIEFHSGLDLAGKMGEAIVATASGVVTWAGPRYGYGNLVEITHGDGYVTRYGHNSKVLVTVGETVKKGQEIAKMGSTGRSTGPHCHYEVWHNGHTVDPMRYVTASN